MNRRSFLPAVGMAATAQPLERLMAAQRAAGKADRTLRIAPCALDIGKGVTVKTLAYNGQVPRGQECNRGHRLPDRKDSLEP